MDIKDLRALVKMITDTDITEFEMETEVERIHLRRGPEKEFVQVATQMAPAAAPSYAPASAPAAVPAVAAAPAASAAADDKYETINSPIVGSFYRKPSPEASNFVEVGTVVEAGQTVCLVEAMKLFNEIEAEFRCKIVEILKDDASPVEYGEPLFKVERL